MAWSIEQIEGMDEDEWHSLPRAEQAEVMAVILESLTADGLAYQGADGRYRMREDVELASDGTATKRRPN